MAVLSVLRLMNMYTKMLFYFRLRPLYEDYIAKVFTGMSTNKSNF